MSSGYRSSSGGMTPGPRDTRGGTGPATQGLRDFSRGLTIVGRDVRDFGAASRGASKAVGLLQNLFGKLGHAGWKGGKQQFAQAAKAAALGNMGEAVGRTALAGVMGGALPIAGAVAGAVAKPVVESALGAAGSVLGGTSKSFSDGFAWKLLEQGVNLPFIGGAMGEVIDPLRRTESIVAGRLGDLAAAGGRISPETRRFQIQWEYNRERRRETEMRKIQQETRSADMLRHSAEDTTESNRSLAEFFGWVAAAFASSDEPDHSYRAGGGR